MGTGDIGNQAILSQPYELLLAEVALINLQKISFLHSLGFFQNWILLRPRNAAEENHKPNQIYKHWDINVTDGTILATETNKSHKFV